FQGVSFDEITHENNRYTLTYEVSFQPPKIDGSESAPETPKGTLLSGKTGKITWGSCQVREAPAKNANVLGKLPRKTEVKLLEAKDGWYRIEYQNKPQAWIFGEAVKVE
ncbi:MAG: SH3 domain-containing protein, partial [Myxococcales bacterium]|nr:SH3 domain-containing protein [Myxococcales bacterium]